MTGDATRDDHATSHNLNSPPSSDYEAEAQVRDAKAAAREQREAEQRERQDAAHEAAKAEKEQCPNSARIDGPWHSWRFDGDDPYIICVFCGKRQDALTGRVIP